MKATDRKFRKAVVLLTFVCTVVVLTGCGTVHHQLRLEPGYTPQAGTKVEVGPVENATGKTVAVNVEPLLADALAEALRREDLLWAGSGPKKLVVRSKIVEYDEGSAVKRWLLPGWGSTVLSIECDLHEADRLVGSVQARRTISIGGFYTVNAWKTVFASIAKDVVGELQTQIGR